MSGTGLGPLVAGSELSLLVALPVGTAFFLLVTSAALRLLFGVQGLPGVLWRAIGLGASGLALLLAVVGVLGQFDPEQLGHQLVERSAWLPEYGIHYFVGVDGISLFLVMLTVLVVPLALLAAWNQIEQQLPSFVFLVLVLESGLLGAFLSLNLLQFFVFGELCFLTAWLVVGIFGGSERMRAATRLVLFSGAGGVVLLAAVLVVYGLGASQGAGFSLDLVAHPDAGGAGLLDVRIPVSAEGRPWWQTQTWLFGAFALAFAMRIPLVPVHTWMPEVNTQAPTAGAALLSALMLKLGAYGLLRFGLPLFPDAAAQLVPVFLGLALAGILHASLVALVQRDLKRWIAYVSLAHLSLALLGIFSLNVAGLSGGIVQLVSHGLTCAALFFLVGTLDERRRTRDVADFGGLAKPMPVFAALLGVVVFAAMGVPALSGFVGELLVLVGSFAVDGRVTALAAAGLAVLAVGLFWTWQRITLGPVESPENRGLIDLDWRERSVCLALVVPILWIGLHPDPLLRRVEPAVLELMRQMDERREAPAAPLPEPAAPDAGQTDTAGGEPV